MSLEEIVKVVHGVVSAGPPLRLAMVFGSAAEGLLREDSDVDVAILPRDPGMELREELDLQVALERGLGRPVDLVRIDRASTLLAWEIARKGLLVMSDPVFEHPRFLARAASDWADFGPAVRDAERRYRQAILTAPAARAATT